MTTPVRVSSREHAQDGITYSISTVREDGIANVLLRVTEVDGKPVDQFIATSVDVDLEKELGVAEG